MSSRRPSIEYEGGFAEPAVYGVYAPGPGPEVSTFISDRPPRDHDGPVFLWLSTFMRGELENGRDVAPAGLAVCALGGETVSAVMFLSGGTSVREEKKRMKPNCL